MEVRCPNCGTSMKIGENGTPINPNTMGGVGYLVPETVRNENVKGEMKMETNEALEMLKKAGFDVSGLDLKKVENDDISKKIFENGYTKHMKNGSRWVPAQTMRLLGWYDGVTKKVGWNNRPYTIDNWIDNFHKYYNMNKMIHIVEDMLERAQAMKIHGDNDAFRELDRFYNHYTAASLVSSYLETLKEYVASLPKKKFHGKLEYIEVGARRYYEDEIEEKLFKPVSKIIRDLNRAYRIEDAVSTFRLFINRMMIRKVVKEMKVPSWLIEDFKKFGAYYTLISFVEQDFIKVTNYETGVVIEDREEAKKYIEECRNGNQGFQLLALLKKCVEKSGLNFKEAIKK